VFKRMIQMKTRVVLGVLMPHPLTVGVDVGRFRMPGFVGLGRRRSARRNVSMTYIPGSGCGSGSGRCGMLFPVLADSW
jgi:hypothetical protein